MMILHIVRNAASYDSRVMKETQSLEMSGLVGQIEICGFHEPGYGLDDCMGTRAIHRIKIRTRPLPKDSFSQSIKYAEWYGRVVRRYRRSPLRVIHCHDLAPLPIAVRLKKLTGAKLVYDAHELETEMYGVRGVRQHLARWGERRLLRHVDAMITVSPSIRDWYAERFPSVPIVLVRNIPEAPTEVVRPRDLRGEMGVPDDALLFVYLGGLSKGRGIEVALDAFADGRVRHHLLFLGNGGLKPLVDAAAARCSRIHHMPPVPSSEVLACAAGADAGLCLYEDTCLNHRYCLPNKLFESLLAGLPVLASDLPDQAAIVRAYGGGWVVPNDSHGIAEFLAGLDAAAGKEPRRGLAARVSGLRWENEAQGLLGLYRSLLDGMNGTVKPGCGVK